MSTHDLINLSKEQVMVTVRREKDSMGVIEVPADKLWGAQT
ncbi:class II fumarate hydratase, partial [Salmonella enterica subsp. enterica serovar Typhi]|nr:class II fumarate hydratase [Salmonella enterica subsp. enterica serovar Typhi]